MTMPWPFGWEELYSLSCAMTGTLMLNLLLIYGVQTNPLTLPKRRITKANNHYDNYIAKRKTADATADNDETEDQQEENAFEGHILR